MARVSFPVDDALTSLTPFFFRTLEADKLIRDSSLISWRYRAGTAVVRARTLTAMFRPPEVSDKFSTAELDRFLWGGASIPTWKVFPVVNSITFLGLSSISTDRLGGGSVFLEEAGESIGRFSWVWIPIAKKMEHGLCRTHPFAAKLFVDVSVEVEGNNATLRSQLLDPHFPLRRSTPKSISARSSGASESILLPPRNYPRAISVGGGFCVLLSVCGILLE